MTSTRTGDAGGAIAWDRAADNRELASIVDTTTVKVRYVICNSTIPDSEWTIVFVIDRAKTTTCFVRIVAVRIRDDAVCDSKLIAGVVDSAYIVRDDAVRNSKPTIIIVNKIVVRAYIVIRDDGVIEYEITGNEDKIAFRKHTFLKGQTNNADWESWVNPYLVVMIATADGNACTNQGKRLI